MKPQACVAAVFLVLSMNGFAACTEHSHGSQSLEGGVMAEVDDMSYELVATPDEILFTCATTASRSA